MPTTLLNKSLSDLLLKLTIHPNDPTVHLLTLVGVEFYPLHTRLEIRNQMLSDLCEVFYLLWVRMIMVAVFGTVVVE
jgi:hypothetical protein